MLPFKDQASGFDWGTLCSLCPACPLPQLAVGYVGRRFAPPGLDFCGAVLVPTW